MAIDQSMVKFTDRIMPVPQHLHPQQPSTQPAQQTPTPSGIDPASMLANIRASAPAAPVQQQSPSSKSGWLSGLWDSTFGALTHAPEILGSVVSPIGIMGVNTPGTPSPVIAKAVTNAPASADLIKKEGALGVAKQLPFVSQAIQNYNDLEDPNSRLSLMNWSISFRRSLRDPRLGLFTTEFNSKVVINLS